MSAHAFFFTMRLADDAGSDDMLNDLTASVLRHVGYAPAAIGALTDEVRAGIATGKAAGTEYDLQFRAHDGEIEIIVSRDDRAVFRTSRRCS